jgi:hypothetical protein
MWFSLPKIVAFVVIDGLSTFYAPQTKILEGGTKDEMRISKEALFKGVSTQFGPRTVDKCFENPHFIFCSSFQNLRLGGVTFHALFTTRGTVRRRDDNTTYFAHQNGHDDGNSMMLLSIKTR